MLAPLGRVRQSIDLLQKNIYEYHHGSSLCLSTDSIRYPSTNKIKPRRCQYLIQLIEESCTIIQAIFVRFIFILSTVVTVWRLVEETKQVYYWYLLLLLIFLIIETYVMVYKRKGYESKWFCSSAFAYLIAIVPCIWLLELNYTFRSLSVSNQTRMPFKLQRLLNFKSSANEYINDFDRDISNSEENPRRDGHALVTKRKYFISTELTPTKIQDLPFETLLKTPQELMLKLNAHLSKEDWHMIIEQMILLVLILSRWLLPKGELTREELSQLLLVYIGIAADIIEFFEVFKEKNVRTNVTLSILVLLFWTLSLLQFCLAFTISCGRQCRLVIKQEQERRFLCSPSDFWGMLMSLLLQDIPFFSFRAILLFHYRIFSYSTVFFTSKNGLIIILQWYRITVIVATTISEERQRYRYQHKKLIQILETNTDGKTINKTDNCSENEENNNNNDNNNNNNINNNIIHV
ncbi:unnamed protein product [Rotaria sp. Silwood1]|nr:unnamed protein product [Rotaria sp. Silwood1]CAF3445660.1 unnamed protein product [Rotaria sp. Silwood1]CAF4691836.1 unnamed protein product [Rotaria sp. Silwood1]